MDKQNNVPGIKLLTNESSIGSGSSVGSYIPTESYVIGDIVNYNGTFYKCIQAGTNKQPDTNPDYWTIYDENLGTFDITDPAVNAAVATSVIDGYAGVNVVLTGAPNAQTMQDPTNTAESKQFIIINDRTSTDNLVITIPYGDIIIESGHAQKFIWNGSEWVLGASNDAKDVTYIPQGGFDDANVQDVLNGLEDGSNYISVLDYRSLAKETANRTIYIATTGDDVNGTGLIGSPFATLHRALKDIKPNLAGKDITIRASYGTYDFTALGDLDLSRFQYSGGRIYIQTESDVQDNNYTVLDTGTFTSDTRFSHTDTGKAWVVDAYDGKFARFDSQTAYKRFMPIIRNSATVLDTGNPRHTLVLSGAYGIVEHKTIFNFGSNNIVVGENYGGVILFTNIEINVNALMGTDGPAYTGFETKQGILYFTNCKVITQDDSSYVPIYGEGSYFHCNSSGSFAPVNSNACAYSNNNGTYITRPYMGNDKVYLHGTIIRGKNGTRVSTGVYALSLNTLLISDIKGINLKILTYLRDSQRCAQYRQISHDDVDFTVRSAYSCGTEIFDNYKGLYGGIYDLEIVDEPNIARFTLNGTTEAETYYDAKANINALAIAPSGYNVATIPDIWTDSNDPTGVVTQSDISISFVPATRVVTIQPNATSFTIYSAGKKYIKTGTDTVTLDAATGGYFVYYDNTGTIQKSTSPWNFTTDVPIAYVIYNHTLVDGFAINERHGIQMSGATHLHLHNNVGTYKYSGFGIADYTAQPAAPVDADNRYSIATGVVADEDLHTTVAALPALGPYTYFYKNGASGEWKWNKTSVNPFAVGTNIQINEWTGATWQLTDVANNNFVNTWVFATPSLDSDFGFIIILDQDEHANLGEAQSQTIEELDLTGLPFVELCLIYKITWGVKAAYSTVGNCRIESVVELVGTAAQILGTAGSSHGTLSGLTNDDHPQYLDRNAIGTVAIAGGSVDIDMNNKDRTYGNIILTESPVINNPTNIAVGAILSIEVTQDASGGWSLSWDTYYTGENGTIPAPTGTGLKSTSYTFEAKTATKLVLKDVVFNY